MRAVSLSDERIVSLLNSSFVPVFTSNEDYRDGGAAPPEERALLTKIHRSGHDKGLSVGSVHAYVVSPDLQVVNSLHTVDAAKPATLLVMLEKATKMHGVKPGNPLVPAAGDRNQKVDGAALTLHVTARYLERKGNALVLVENAGGNWSALPGEDILAFRTEEARGFRPPSGAKLGAKWPLPSELANRLYMHIYPPTENNDPAKNKILESAAECTLDSVNGERARVSVTGRLRMKHPFYHKEDDWVASATFAGYYDLDRSSGIVRRFHLVTDSAEYANGSQRLPFGVAVRSVP